MSASGLTDPLALPPCCIAGAASRLAEFGVVLIPSFLPPSAVQPLTDAALSDFEAASAKLLERGIDLSDPSTCPGMNYHELSAREDHRVDLRNGPAAKEMYGSPLHEQLTSIPGIVEIVERAFTPRSEADPTLHLGNYGLHNFGGRGPEETPAAERGRFGCVISAPGASDQAIHADTPHLFHHAQCPAHYVNFFVPGIDAGDEVGWTAFVPGSHELGRCRDLMEGGAAGKRETHEATVRPRHGLGDVLLFDCRVLHFGTGNTGGVVRPLHYVNYFKQGFRDNKNWDDRERIFS
jgi:hypothetical protein